MTFRIIKVISAIFWVLGLIGLATLPEDWPVFVRRFGSVAAMITPDRLVLVLLVLSSAGFAWTIFAPTMVRWWRSRKEPPLKIEFPAEINSGAKYGANKRSTQFLATDGPQPDRVVVSQYFFDVTNTTRRTIRNVSIQVHIIDNPLPFSLEQRLQTRGGKALIDIPPGYTDFFCIGFCHKYGNDTVAEHVTICKSEVLNNLKSQWIHEPGFMLQLEGHSTLRLLKNNSLRLILGVYADDIPPTRHRFTINCKDRVEIFYEGEINLDATLAPRRPQDTGSGTPR